MQITEFIEETNKIEKFYNKSLEQYEKDIWFQNLKLLSVKRYQEIIKRVFVENKFMPKLADIIEINKEMPYDKPKVVKEQCNICHGKGFKTYKKIIKNGNVEIPYTYVARCNCRNGNLYLAFPSIAEVNIYDK